MTSELQPQEPDYTHTSSGLTDADVRATMLASIRTLLILTLIAVPLVCWRSRWQNGVLLFVGAAISSTSLWEWFRLITLINTHMDAPQAPSSGTAEAPVRVPLSTASVLFGFFGRLLLTLAALYGSLRYLHGSVLALAAGLGLGLVSLSIEALRLLKRRP